MLGGMDALIQLMTLLKHKLQINGEVYAQFPYRGESQFGLIPGLRSLFNQLGLKIGEDRGHTTNVVYITGFKYADEYSFSAPLIRIVHSQTDVESLKSFNQDKRSYLIFKNEDTQTDKFIEALMKAIVNACSEVCNHKNTSDGDVVN
eukprot:TCONS_00011264-protein